MEDRRVCNTIIVENRNHNSLCFIKIVFEIRKMKKLSNNSSIESKKKYCDCTSKVDRDWIFDKTSIFLLFFCHFGIGKCVIRRKLE